jgi:hypothetical protein
LTGYLMRVVVGLVFVLIPWQFLPGLLETLLAPE